MRTSSSPGQRETAMSPGDDEVNQNANRNSNGGGRRSSSQGPSRYSYDNADNDYPGRPNTRAEQDKIQNCVILFTIWLLMIVAGFFLIYYLYNLEWDPVMSDSVSVFGLGLAVTILYITFVIDICVGILILISRQDYVKPYNSRIFWIAIIILILNLLHGIFIWLWVWTGEYPRTCGKNTFYYGKHCVDIEMIMAVNTDPDGTLSLGTCKCDYGQCLPECKGLREVQTFFWGTYWLVFLRLVVLVMLFRPLRRAFCECQWCCCKDPATMEGGGTRRVSQAPYTSNSGTYAKEGYNSSGKILPLSDSNNNSTLPGGDKSKMNGSAFGGRNFGDGNSKAYKAGNDPVFGRATKPSEMSYGFNDYNRNSEDGTFTGTTIMGTGAGHGGTYKEPPKESKMGYGFNEYNRNSEDGTYTGTTIKGRDSGRGRAKEPSKIIYASECRETEPSKMSYGSECTRETEPIKITYGSECIRETEPSKMTNGFTEYKRNSEDGTFTGTTIKGTVQDTSCTMPPKQSKMTYGFNEYKRNSEDGTYTGTTIKGTVAGQDTGCTRAKDSRKTSYDFTAYKRNSKDGTFTGTTMRGTAARQDSECTRATYQSGSSAYTDYTDYTRDSEDGTYTGTTIKGNGSGCEQGESLDKRTKGKESVKTGDGCDTVTTIVPKREIFPSCPQDSVGKKEPVGRVNQGTGESMHIRRKI